MPTILTQSAARDLEEERRNSRFCIHFFPSPQAAQAFCMFIIIVTGIMLFMTSSVEMSLSLLVMATFIIAPTLIIILLILDAKRTRLIISDKGMYFLRVKVETFEGSTSEKRLFVAWSELRTLKVVFDQVTPATLYFTVTSNKNRYSFSTYEIGGNTIKQNQPIIDSIRRHSGYETRTEPNGKSWQCTFMSSGYRASDSISDQDWENIK